MADPIESQVNITGDAGPLKDELGQVRNIYEDINKDAEAFNTILSDTETRQQSILKGWNDVLAAIRDSESALRSLNTTEEAQQTSMRAFRQEIMEILQSVKGLGGNINNVMSIFQMAGGRGGGSFGSFQGAGYGGGYGSGDYSTASQDFRSTVGSTTAGIDLSSTQQVQQAQYANRTQSITPIEYDDDNDAGSLGGVFGGTYNSSRRPGERKPFGTESLPVPKKARQIRLQEQLDQYKDIAASASIGYAMDTLKNTVGSIPGVGGPIVTAIRKSLNLSGVTNRNVRNAERNNTTRSVDPTTGETIFTRTGEYSDVEQKALKFADHIAGIFGNKMISSVMKYGGYAQMGVGLAEGIASNIRQVTGFAQSQGSVFGLTDFNRSASMTFGALVKSGFGLNPNYSFQQVMQSQMMGAALGLKGDQLNNYVNNALNMQTTYGLDATQSQQLLGGGLGVGVGMNANMQGIAAMRSLANATQTSTAYANKAYMQGMTGAAGMGAAPQASARLGDINAAFGAGDLVSQAAGITMQESLATQFGTAMFAKSTGVGYMDVFSQMRKMGAEGIASVNQTTNMQILSMAGINTSDLSALQANNYEAVAARAQYLQMILSSLGLQNIRTPQDALAWAKDVISATVQNNAGVNYAMQGGVTTASNLAKGIKAATPKPNPLGLIPKGGTAPLSNLIKQELTADNTQVTTLITQMRKQPRLFGGANSSEYQTASNALVAANKYITAGNDTAAQKEINVVISIENEAKKHLKAVAKKSRNGHNAGNGNKNS